MGPDLTAFAAFSGSEALRRRSVLLVEDDGVDRLIISRALQRARPGTAVLHARALGPARRILRARPVDILLLDNALPDGNGTDFAVELSRSRDFRGLPVYIVSDWPSPLMWDKARAAGVRGVFEKAQFNPRRIV